MQIGLKDLYMAKITTTGGAETFSTPERLAKAIKVDLETEVAEGVLYADDAVDEIVKEFVKGTIKLNINDLDPEKYAMILGQTTDDDKVIYAGENDEPPYIALGFRSKKGSGGKYRYVWLYRVKFKIPNESYETKGDGINFITPELEGEFIKRDSDGMWKADYTGLPSDTVAAAWFTKVKEYTAPVVA